MNCCSDPYKKYYFLREHDEVFQMDRNCFNRFRYLGEVRTNLQKCTILGNLRTITQEGKKETKQLTPFFILSLSSNCSLIFTFVFENCQNSFSWRLPHWSILVCKVPEFWRWNIGDQNFVLFDSGNIHIKESKEPGFTFLSSWESNLSDLMSRMFFGEFWYIIKNI